MQLKDLHNKRFERRVCASKIGLNTVQTVDQVLEPLWGNMEGPLHQTSNAGPPLSYSLQTREDEFACHLIQKMMMTAPLLAVVE